MDALYRNRIEEFRFVLLNKHEEQIGELTTVKGGSISRNGYAAIQDTGRLQMVLDSQIDWLNDRVAIYYRLKSGQEWLEWPLGVFLLGTDGRDTQGSSLAGEAQLYDKSLILQQDILDASYTVAAGTNVVTAITNIIQDATGSLARIEETDQVLENPRTWGMGTAKHQVINDLLGAINYRSLYVDGQGVYRAERYVPPQLRNPVWTFFDDERSLYAPQVKVTADYFKIPNKVILMNTDTEQEMGVVDTLDRLLPNSPYSFSARGRWITRHETVEATSVEVLAAMAERMLLEGVQVVERVEYNHPWLPINPHDAVLFRHTELGLMAKYTVHSQEIKLTPGELTQAAIRRVVT